MLDLTLGDNKYCELNKKTTPNKKTKTIETAFI
jgi:hypothetical protein